MKHITKQTLGLFGKGRNGNGQGTKEKTLQQAKTIGDFMQSQGLRNIQDMKLKHCEKFMNELKEKELSLSTMANYATVLREIASRIGKGDMIARTNQEAFGFTRELDDRRQPVQADLDKAAQVTEALREAPGREWAALGREMADAFGLRRQEALRNCQTIERDGKTWLEVKDGTKGGKPRLVEVQTSSQRDVLARVQAHIATTGGKSLIPAEMGLKQGLQNFSNWVSRGGGTKSNNAHTHALRHEWVQQRTGEGMADKDLTQQIGHGRTEILASYRP